MNVFKYTKIFFNTVFGLTINQRLYKGSKVNNFGKIDSNLYRGSRPEKADYTYLKNKLGIKTVLDLTLDHDDWCSDFAKQLNINYINIKIDDHSYPFSDQVDSVEKVILNKELYPIFVHCNGGRHRTGVVVGMYRRLVYGWRLDEIYEEMKKYDFYTEFGHEDLKIFIFDYILHN